MLGEILLQLFILKNIFVWFLLSLRIPQIQLSMQCKLKGKAKKSGTGMWMALYCTPTTNDIY